MPVKPDSRFANLNILQVQAPDGSVRRVVALRLGQPVIEGIASRHMVTQDEPLDLLAYRLYGSEGLWWRILDANPLIYPFDIQPGDVLNLPTPGPVTRITRARSF
jgi:hypothetical protein